MERIRVIDEDQGKSGAYSENRSGFRGLMGSIAAGEVGIVLGLEVSRLARDNADWHQLLRIAGISNTLILDETGIYDPNDSNDRLLLGMKGTMSEFELQGIKARLLGGQRSAAGRGALKIRLPVGLAYNDKDEVVFDPDRSVVDAIRLVFDSFRRMGSAMAVAKWMHRENIALPSRPRSGPVQTEHRAAELRAVEERTLRESEERYRNLIDVSPDAKIVESGGRVVFANPAALHTFGAEAADQVIGLSASDLLSSGKWETLIHQLPVLADEATTNPSVEVRFKRQDNSIFDGELSHAAISWSGEPATLVEVRDITERKRMEVVLQQAKWEAEQAAQLAESAMVEGRIGESSQIGVLGVDEP